VFSEVVKKFSIPFNHGALQLAAHVYEVDIATIRDGAAGKKNGKSSKSGSRKSIATN
jgi:hypothetical protein